MDSSLRLYGGGVREEVSSGAGFSGSQSPTLINNFLSNPNPTRHAPARFPHPQTRRETNELLNWTGQESLPLPPTPSAWGRKGGRGRVQSKLAPRFTDEKTRVQTEPVTRSRHRETRETVAVPGLTPASQEPSHILRRPPPREEGP